MSEAGERVKQAIEVQRTGQPDQIREANHWLERFQSTTEAWQVADQLLASVGEANGVLTFAAHTLRSKIQFDWIP